ERASGVFDARHVLNANLVYELPFGAGKAYLSEPGIARALFGSWQLNSIVEARTGFPINVTVDRASGDVPDGNTNNQRPDIVPGVSLTRGGGWSVGLWLNPAAFVAPAAGTFGDAPRNIGRGPGAWQMDFGLSKRITLTERMQLQFRTEVFNIFNHPQYAN